MRITNAIIFFLICLNTHSQIQIPDVGDEWKSRVESALILINEVDSSRYRFIEDNCTKIDFWISDFSSTVENGTILIPQREAQFGSITNLAAIIVHESMHLSFTNNLIDMNDNIEEIICYLYELDFLLKVPNAESWLINNAKEKILHYSTNKKSQE